MFSPNNIIIAPSSSHTVKVSIVQWILDNHIKYWLNCKEQGSSEQQSLTIPEAKSSKASRYYVSGLVNMRIKVHHQTQRASKWLPLPSCHTDNCLLGEVALACKWLPVWRGNTCIVKGTIKYSVFLRQKTKAYFACMGEFTFICLFLFSCKVITKTSSSCS